MGVSSSSGISTVVDSISNSRLGAQELTNIGNTLRGGIQLDEIIGMPPESTDDKTLKIQRKTMPIISLWPGEPKFAKGLDLFNLDLNAGLTSFRQILSELNITMYGGANRLKVAYLVESPFTEELSTNYTESFMSNLLNTGSQGLRQLSFFVGEKNLSSALQKLGAELGLGGVGKLTGSAIQGAIKFLSEFITGGPAAGAVAQRLLMGHRIDFPKMWENSMFTRVYNFTVRLYNPYSQSSEAFRRNIIAPLGALLALSLPRSEDGFTYKWPLLVRAQAKGLWLVEKGFITNVSVIKGGDQNVISNNINEYATPAMVDVRMSIGDVYQTMLATSKASSTLTSSYGTVRTPGSNKGGRASQVGTPTLKKYLDAMDGSAESSKNALSVLTTALNALLGGEASFSEITRQYKNLTSTATTAVSAVTPTKTATKANATTTEVNNATTLSPTNTSNLVKNAGLTNSEVNSTVEKNLKVVGNADTYASTSNPQTTLNNLATTSERIISSATLNPDTTEAKAKLTQLSTDMRNNTIYSPSTLVYLQDQVDNASTPAEVSEAAKSVYGHVYYACSSAKNAEAASLLITSLNDTNAALLKGATLNRNETATALNFGLSNVVARMSTNITVRQSYLTDLKNCCRLTQNL